MPTFEIQTKEFQRIVKVCLNNDAVRTEAGAMYYMQGNINMTAKAPSVGGLFKSMLTSESLVRPVYEGTGDLFLEPSFGEFTLFNLDGEEWILDKGAYYASEMGVTVDMVTNKAISGLFSGEGFFQTKLSGKGQVVIASAGPLEEIVLNNDKLVVDGSFAVARTAGLQFKVEKAAKGIFGSVISGEGLVNTFTGTGKVLLCPASNIHAYLSTQLVGLQGILASAKSK